ncbi:MAG: hypothetical protein AB7N76_09585 [Planctomycetota bacterium]
MGELLTAARALPFMSDEQLDAREEELGAGIDRSRSVRDAWAAGQALGVFRAWRAVRKLALDTAGDAEMRCAHGDSAPEAPTLEALLAADAELARALRRAEEEAEAAHQLALLEQGLRR